MKQRLETSGCDIYEFFRQDTTGRRKQMKQEKKGKAYVRSGFVIVDEEKDSEIPQEKENRTEDSRKEVVKDAEKEREDDDGYEKDLLYLSQTGECDREDDRSSESYYGVSGLYAEKL